MLKARWSHRNRCCSITADLPIQLKAFPPLIIALVWARLMSCINFDAVCEHVHKYIAINQDIVTYNCKAFLKC